MFKRILLMKWHLSIFGMVKCVTFWWWHPAGSTTLRNYWPVLEKKFLSQGLNHLKQASGTNQNNFPLEGIPIHILGIKRSARDTLSHLGDPDSSIFPHPVFLFAALVSILTHTFSSEFSPWPAVGLFWVWNLDRTWSILGVIRSLEDPPYSACN